MSEQFILERYWLTLVAIGITSMRLCPRAIYGLILIIGRLSTAPTLQELEEKSLRMAGPGIYISFSLLGDLSNCV
jgi:hypothetical protein